MKGRTISIGKPIVYTLRTCPACNRLKQDWSSRGVEFEERPVNDSQTWLDEALKYGDMVPITVYSDGRVEVGYAGMIC